MRLHRSIRKHATLSVAPVVALLFIGLVHVPPVPAEPWVEAVAVATGAPSDGEGAPSGVMQAAATAPYAEAIATATYGELTLYGRGVGPANTTYDNAGNPRTRWQDHVVIDAPGLTGQAGTVTVSFEFLGALFVDADYPPNMWDYAANVGIWCDFWVRGPWTIDLDWRQECGVRTQGWPSYSEPYGTNFLNQQISPTFPIVFGEERFWRMRLEMTATAIGVSGRGALGWSEAIGDLSEQGGPPEGPIVGGLWNGIVAVRDAQGNLVENYSVTAVSGHDWRANNNPTGIENPAPTSTTPITMNAAEPNPARDHSRVAFTMQRGGEARVDVFNAAGERIRTLLESHQAAGSHEVVWDGRDDNGSAVGSGVYFFRLDALGQESTRRLVLVR
jgi:hypothetical protein